ncbi:hypothetical protein SISSUDRAFT_998788 [Sistotremastrum suecicum HHB10207 ss-3]|uniref:Nuclear protein DGCR14 n=1 Tax=Sistotremastrum suecicum HHB10207 ss-3 TaxID=1314776 RepID=A0A166HD60_9AGAM|nr:hypothetical protein SISSUDRAFT_998788 [Sistotremastrum suecicum HHB10207 ss-3]
MTPESTIARSDSNARPTRSLNRQVVLEEDEYTAAVSHIIARDFFPSLVQLDATNNYLDALASEDPHLIGNTARRLAEVQATPAFTATQTPLGGSVLDTPRNPSLADFGPPKKRPRYNRDLSLDEFQARYTSEDNSSFTEILEEENKERRQKWGWAWNAQERANSLKDKQIEVREKLLIEPSVPGVRSKLRIEQPRPVGLITNSAGDDEKAEEADDSTKEKDEEKDEVKETGMILLGTGQYGDSEESQVNVLAKKKDTRPAGVEGWAFKARNGLMFPPDADIAPYDALQEKVTIGRGAPGSIQHANTRTVVEEDASPSVSQPPTPSRSLVDAAVSGTPYRPRSPKIGGFSLVPNVPSPTPAQLGPAALKQLMTVGQITGTPRVLSSDDDIAPSTPFHIPNLTPREVTANKLSSDASRSLRNKAAMMAGSTPRASSGAKRKTNMDPPSWTPKHAPGNLTPAARRLLDRTVGSTARTRRAEVMGASAGWEGKKPDKGKDISRVRWTPSPRM